MKKSITAHLMGGLGNQMFQYAAARALSYRNSVPLCLDTRSGFIRDKVYNRLYELGIFPIQAQISAGINSGPYYAEKIIEKVFGARDNPIRDNFFWTTLQETRFSHISEVSNYVVKGNTWMHGYWQSEKYFEAVKEEISNELMPPAPYDSKFLYYADMMRSCNSISLGVRLFEEVPGASKEGVGGLTPMSFFNDAVKKMCESVIDPEFFIFCTTNSPKLDELQLPGKVHFITHDNGFHGTTERLWLYTQCKHHIIANSSFYWWGAWLSERRNAQSKIIASPMFYNIDTIPPRWLTVINEKELT